MRSCFCGIPVLPDAEQRQSRSRNNYRTESLSGGSGIQKRVTLMSVLRPEHISEHGELPGIQTEVKRMDAGVVNNHETDDLLSKEGPISINVNGLKTVESDTYEQMIRESFTEDDTYVEVVKRRSKRDKFVDGRDHVKADENNVLKKNS